MSSLYIAYSALCITVLKQVNQIVDEPYMDEPFHIPQAQAYCRGEFDYWDPKITTPPGLYLMSLAVKKLFLFKCTLPMLRLTTTLSLLVLPLVLTRLLCFHQRIRPPSSVLTPSAEAVILSLFPVGWFFGFLYYTEVPSLVLVAMTVVSAGEEKHWLAALFGLLSCTFRQTNIIWVLYAFATSQLMRVRFQRPQPPTEKKLHDPMALTAHPNDMIRTALSLTSPSILFDILAPARSAPYILVFACFGAFVVWNGGIVLGDKSNHVPTLHIPQIYYFLAFSAAFGWPVLVSRGGLVKEAVWRMVGTKGRSLVTIMLIAGMGVTVKLFTIHHPFLLSDNRHYTFYVWHRIYMAHWTAPYLLIPGYIACGWLWFLRAGADQSLLQTLILPIFASLTLLPTPLLEPRYFLIPYVLLRSQATDVPTWAMGLELLWYAAINAVTMGVFLYMPREGVGRFIW